MNLYNALPWIAIVATIPGYIWWREATMSIVGSIFNSSTTTLLCLILAITMLGIGDILDAMNRQQKEILPTEESEDRSK